jgi:TolA-binding protein
MVVRARDPQFEAFMLSRAVLLRATLSLPLTSLVATACVTTRDEGAAMRTDIATLKDEVASSQRRLTDEREMNGRRIDALGQRLGALEQTINGMRQADADTGVQLEKMISELQLLRGEMEEARHQLGETKESVADILARPPVGVAAATTAPKVETPNVVIGGQTVPDDAQKHYDLAKQLFDGKKWGDAAEAFDLFVQRHGDRADLANNASYWKAESYFGLASTLDGKGKEKEREKALKQAILAYQRVLEAPKSGKADGALLKIGMCFEQLKYKDEAKVFYEELIAKHPKSPLVADAKKRLRTLRTDDDVKRSGKADKKNAGR